MSSGSHEHTVGELVERAKGYPFVQPTGSYVFTHGRLYPVPHPSGPWTHDLQVAEADGTIAFAEVSLPDRGRCGLRRGLAHSRLRLQLQRRPTPSPTSSPCCRHVVIPSIRCRVTDWDAVYSCHFSRGYIPGAIHPSPGTGLHGTMRWLTDEELELMNASENLGTNYEFRPLKRAVATFETGETDPSAPGLLHPPRRSADQRHAGRGRRHHRRQPPLRSDGREPEVLELVLPEVAPDQTLDEMIASAIESFETQQELTAKLKDCHFTTPGGVPDPPSG